jgi:hypothetical protein
VKHVLWFSPAYPGNISLPTFLSAFGTLNMLSSRGIGMGITGISTHDIAWVRNFALTLFYDLFPHSTHLLMVDSDMSFPPELVYDMIAFDEPLVGALYRKKTMEMEWAASALPEINNRGPFLEVEGLGCGCMLIRRDLVTAMLEQMPHLSDERENTAVGFAKEAGLKRIIRAFDQMDNATGGVISEDISFCKRWRSIGGQVWGAAHHNVEHIGLYSFGGSFMHHDNESKKLKVEAEEEARIRGVLNDPAIREELGPFLCHQFEEALTKIIRPKDLKPQALAAE